MTKTRQGSPSINVGGQFRDRNGSSHVVHAYCRASTEDQTTDQQRMAIETAYPDGTPIQWYSENESGWQGKRSEWNALCEGIRRGRVKEVVSCNIARLGRNQRDILVMLQTCLAVDCKIKILDSPIDFSTPIGVGLFALLAAFAQVDSDTKSRNIKRKFEWKRKQDPSWKMHGNVKDTVSAEVKEKSTVVYTMLDQGKCQAYIAKMLSLSEHTVGKLKRMRGKELLTRKEYAERFPGWHKVKVDQRPDIPAK